MDGSLEVTKTPRSDGHHVVLDPWCRRKLSSDLLQIMRTKNKKVPQLFKQPTIFYNDERKDLLDDASLNSID